MNDDETASLPEPKPSVQEADPSIERWRAAKRRAADSIDPIADRVLRETATRAWGRGLLRPPWRLIRTPEDASWRAYRYLGTAGPADHRYAELGVLCHLDPDGNVVGFGVDNGVDFLGIKDASEYGLRRALEYIRLQRARPRRYESPVYDHGLRAMT